MADVDGDGQLEVVAGDTLGTLAVFTAQGHEVWERHVKSGLSQVRLVAGVNAGLRCACWGAMARMSILSAP